MEMRIGFGYDVHRLEEGRELIIGGVKVPFDKGSVAHSDGDVLIHAICDAILGALGQGDIGRHFPDTDPENKGLDSMKILEHCLQLAENAGYHIVNVDSTVCLQQPRLSPFIEQMKKKITPWLKTQAVSIKATTTEKMGFVGEGKGISAYAAVLLDK